MTSNDTRDPAAERMASIEQRAAAVHQEECDHTDTYDLAAFARDVLAITDQAEQRDPGRTTPRIHTQAIRDAAARHLGGQHE